MKHIIVENATINNLHNFSIIIPKGKFIALTGISGSGKSSLVFDLLYTEAKRMYLQSLGIIPDLDFSDINYNIEGVSPIIAVKQTIIRDNNPKSLVGTRSRLLDLLRKLYVTIGTINCPECGEQTFVGSVCQACQAQVPSMKEDILNFNSYNGMCFQCMGFGYCEEPDINKIIPDENISLKQICKKLYTWSKSDGPQAFFDRYSVNPEMTYSMLPDDLKDVFLYGYFHPEYGKYGGLIPHIKYKANFKSNEKYKKSFFKTVKCDCCNGLRISEEAMTVTLNGSHIGQLGEFNIAELKEFLMDIQKLNLLTMHKGKQQITQMILTRLQELIYTFIDVGLDYLSLYREMRTLSGGEMQRFLLMSHIDAETDGFIYIFDEPTLGLHESEKTKLLDKIDNLYKQGNTVIVVEHDRSVIQRANYFIDIGPGAGKNGGKIVYQGDYNGFFNCEESITGNYLSGKRKLPDKKASEYKQIDLNTPKIKMKGVRTNNLKRIDVDIPLGVITGIAGVSGSGKSSLIISTLVPILHKYFSGKSENPINDIESDELSLQLSRIKINDIMGLHHIQGFASITQMPIGRNRRSIPATYVGVWDNIRKLYAAQETAKKYGFSLDDFSFNSIGACPLCGGTGVVESNLGMMGEICYPCTECQGKRYRKDVLLVKYKEKSISDILDMDITEAVEFFEDKKTIFKKLKLCHDTGLGYLKLGQPTPTLSGGEAQRIKIAKDLNSARKGHILYILDEPTMGLSYYDIEKLLDLLNRIAQDGNSIIIVEHDPYMLSICDWIIEIGPGAGGKGGKIIAQGTPFQLTKNEKSNIGQYLFKESY